MKDDTISRRMAIDAVEESRRLNHHQDGKEACAHEYEHRHFLKILIDLPSTPQWILCSNTVDIPDYEVLCCDKRGNELIGWLFYSNGQWICESEGEIMYGTIAWMSLPEPYKAERRGKWINHRNDEGHNIADCDQCGEAMQWYDPDPKPNYCPNCGAKMEGCE